MLDWQLAVYETTKMIVLPDDRGHLQAFIIKSGKGVESVNPFSGYFDYLEYCKPRLHCDLRPASHGEVVGFAVGPDVASSSDHS